MGEESNEVEKKNDFGMIFFVLTLVVGVSIKVLQRKFGFKAPYAVLLLIVGFCLGILDNRVNLGFLSESIGVWKGMESRSLLVMFLPPLLFASASSIDFHVFRRLAAQAILLAGPGVLVSALLTAPIPVYLFPDSFTFTSGMLFGSMFAATDPVAVVALLQELGAPKTLSVLIEGESLLNDGIAFALFLLFLAQVTGEKDPTFGEMVSEILFMSVIGVLIGVVGGLICVASMSHIWNDPVLEITVTIVVAWGVFLIGDAVEASGVLAVVAFGLTFASQASSHLSGEVQHAMKEVWHMLEYIANTLVFVFSGIVCADAIISSNHFDYIHVLWLFFLYVALNVIRMIMVGFFYYPLLKWGYGFDWRRGALVSWSGLRGAVGLVAAIEVSETTTCVEGSEEHEVCMPADIKDLIMFYMSGIVILTILINGTSTQLLVNRLGITRRSHTAKRNLDASLETLTQTINDSITNARADPDLTGADWNVVWNFMPVLLEKQEAKHGVVSPLNPSSNGQSFVSEGLFAKKSRPDEVMEEIRFRYLSFVKADYRAQFEEGMCGSWPTLQTLNEAASHAQDNANQRLNEWDGFLARECELSEKKCFQHMYTTKQRAARAYDIAYSFIKAHEFADEHIESFAKNFGVESIIAAESLAMRDKAQATLTHIQTAYDDVAASVKTGMAISRTLRHAHEQASEMLHLAEMDERDFELIDAEFKKRILHVKRALGFVKVRSADELLHSLPFFYSMDPKDVKLVKQNALLRRFASGEAIFQRGTDRPGNLYLIIRGQVSFTLKREQVDELQGLERRASTRHLVDRSNSFVTGPRGPRARRGSAVETSALQIKRLAEANFSSDDDTCTPADFKTLVMERLASPRSANSSSKSKKRRSCIGHRLVQDDNTCGDHNAASSKEALAVMGGPIEMGHVELNTLRFGCSTGECQPCENERDVVEYIFGRGDTVGELEILGESSGVTEVRCQSMVEAFEIKRSWLLKYFEQNGPDCRLRRNLARHAGLVALESFFPILRSAPESLRTWVLGKLQIIYPPANLRYDPLPGESGIAVILRGALLATNDRLLAEPISSITIFELPDSQQVYAENTLLVLLPGAATTLLQSSNPLLLHAQGDASLGGSDDRTNGGSGGSAKNASKSSSIMKQASFSIQRQLSFQRPTSRSLHTPMFMSHQEAHDDTQDRQHQSAVTPVIYGGTEEADERDLEDEEGECH